MATLILTTNQRHYIPVSSISHFTFITEVQEAPTDPPIRCSIDAIAFTGKRLPIFHHYYRRSWAPELFFMGVDYRERTRERMQRQGEQFMVELLDMQETGVFTVILRPEGFALLEYE